MNGLDPNAMSAYERMSEIALIFARGVIRRHKKLKTEDVRDYSLDLEAAGSIHARNAKKEISDEKQCIS